MGKRVRSTPLFCWQMLQAASNHALQCAPQTVYNVLVLF